jgi:protein-tyrosine phosphatase
VVVPPFTHTWIEPGKVLIGSIPSKGADMDALLDMGIRHILSLTRRDFRDYHDPNWQHGDVHLGTICGTRGIHVFRFPIPDNGVPEKSINPVLEYLAIRYNSNQPVFIHCRGGIGRSGMILQAYYCFYRDKTLEEARDLLRIRRNYEGNATAADQGSPQREWLERMVKSVE